MEALLAATPADRMADRRFRRLAGRATAIAAAVQREKDVPCEAEYDEPNGGIHLRWKGLLALWVRPHAPVTGRHTNDDARHRAFEVALRADGVDEDEICMCMCTHRDPVWRSARSQ